jgi:DNA-binding transcriptional regulator YhcF (GntR family)
MGVIIKINKQSKRPIFSQIMDQIIELVDSEALKPGARLPSTRSLANKLAVNRSTVYNAYQELWSLGYLESTPGSYSTVRKRARVVSKNNKPDKGLIEWHKRSTSGSEGLYVEYLKEQALFKKVGDSEVINFIPLSHRGKNATALYINFDG